MEEEVKEQQKVYTPQELEQLRKDTVKYYKDKNSVLEQQAQNEELQAKIAEAQLRTLIATIKRMQIMAPPEEEIEEGAKTSSVPEKKTPLKKV